MVQEQGVRIATFTWNYENLLGYPNRFYDPIQRKVWSEGDERGLKERGIQALELMEALGIIRMFPIFRTEGSGMWRNMRKNLL